LVWGGQGLSDIMLCDGWMSPQDMPRPIPGFQRDMQPVSGPVHVIQHAQHPATSIEVIPNMQFYIRLTDTNAELV
jgi:hypothetical protein